MIKMSYESYLEHHGIKGMRWGIRRYQNPDGSLKAAGQNRNLVDRAKAGFGKVKSAIGRDLETRALRSERTTIKNEHFRKNYQKELNTLKAKEGLAREFEKNTKKGGVANAISKGVGDYYQKERNNKTIKYSDESLKYANKKIVEKYGQKAMDRIEDQEFRDGMVIFGTALTAFGAYGAASLMGKI